MDDLPFNPIWLDDAGLSPSEFRVFLHVCRRSNGGRVTCSAEVGTMAAVCRLRVETVRAALRALEARGLVEQTPRPGRTTERRPRPLPSIRRGDPTPETVGVSKETPPLHSPDPSPHFVEPLPPNAADPLRLRGDEGAVEGAFEGASEGRESRPMVEPIDGDEAGRLALAAELLQEAQAVARDLGWTLTKTLTAASTIQPGNGHGCRSFTDPRRPGVSRGWIETTLRVLPELRTRERRPVPL